MMVKEMGAATLPGLWLQNHGSSFLQYMWGPESPEGLLPVNSRIMGLSMSSSSLHHLDRVLWYTEERFGLGGLSAGFI